jgi:NAD(P)-dependent dehydrogenase (short-subunit alcohol dehydrogenase family)
MPQRTTASDCSEARLAGLVAIVTDASSGIGQGVAERLALDGASVCINYPAHFQWKRKGSAGADSVPDPHDPSKRRAPSMLTTDLSLRFDPAYSECEIPNVISMGFFFYI